MNRNSRSFAVLGSGPMGLMAALELLQAGHAVDVYERDDRIGGMSASFDFDGLRIERYYHFVCRTDFPLFALLERLGLRDRLHWTATKMGYFVDGRLHDWGTPWALLKFPGLGLVDKFRYALHVMRTKRVRDWTALERDNATAWLRRNLGERGYRKLWQRVIELKFFEHTDDLSAAWIGTRIKRVALSRTSLFEESLGWLQGGSEGLLQAMAQAVRDAGGRIHLSAPAAEVTSADGRVTGVRIGDVVRPHDTVLSTAPIQYVPALVPGLPAEFAERIRALRNLPVACVILKLKRPLTKNFWTNIADPDIEIPGLIEYSNLNPTTGDAIVYAPFYMPKTHPKWQRTNDELIDEVISYLPRLNPDFRADDVLARRCHRYEFAQPLCPPGFAAQLPPMRTPLAGFFMADTAYYYPEDRSISESVAVGARLAAEAMA